MYNFETASHEEDCIETVTEEILLDQTRDDEIAFQCYL